MKRLLTILLVALSVGLNAQIGRPGPLVAAASGGGAVPDVLTNTDSTLFWSYASVDNIVTDGQDSVTQWTDLSGNDNHLTASDGTGACPFYNSGTDSISFDGNGNYLYKAIAAADQPFTLYAVIRINSDAVDATLFAGIGTNRVISQTSTNRFQIYSSSGYRTATGVINKGNWQILRFTVNGSNSAIKQNDNTLPPDGLTDAGSNDFDGIGIANDGTASGNFGFFAVKALVVSVATGSATESEIYTYLKNNVL